MKVTIHLNEAHGSYFGFTPSKAELVDAGTYDLPVTECVPAADSAERESYAKSVLNRVYEQLNIGGDLIPAQPYTAAYRAAGGRSLSVGDLVTLDDDSNGFRGTYAVDRIGFQKVPAAEIVIRRGLARQARNAEVFA
jgi:hypothetical protein